jgi:hypothetical protein
MVSNALSQSFKTLLTTLACMLLSVSLPLWANSVTVQTDRQQVEMGDIVTLTIDADFQSRLGQPDLSALQDQFELLGSQRSSNIQIVNGDFQTSTRWLVQLLPKQAGELMIPPIDIDGVKSQAYQLSVKPLASPLQQGALPPFFLKAEVSPPEPYVQQQVLYTLRFYYQGRYVDGAIRPPQFDNALVQLLRDGEVFNKQIQGQSYTVYEWIYALYPQKSGDLNVSTPSFNGRIQYQGRLKQIQENANDLTLKVKPVAADFTRQAHNAWLPAKRLALKQEWTLPDEIHVGDSLTQTLTLQADGLMASQLPTLDFSVGDDFKVYPDQPSSDQKASPQGVMGAKQLKRALIPTQAGELHIPAQTFHWWNTQTDRLESITLEAKTLTVLPAKNNPAALTPQAANPLAAATQPSVPDTSADRGFWPWLSAVFAALWLLTLGLWWQARRQGQNLAEAQQSNAQKSSKKTQQAGSDLATLCVLPPQTLYAELKRWLQRQHRINAFSELQDAQLIESVRRLEAHLYHAQDWSETERTELCEALKAFGSARQTTAKSHLKPLYENGA